MGTITIKCHPSILPRKVIHFSEALFNLFIGKILSSKLCDLFRIWQNQSIRKLSQILSMLSLLRKHSNRKSVGYRFQHHVTGKMDNTIERLKTLFLSAVDSVKPKALFAATLKNENIAQQLRIVDKRYHVVGFGKAVLGMAVQLEHILGDRLATGLINIPVGTLQRFENDEDYQLRSNSMIQIIECAPKNLPDEKAMFAAKAIISLAGSLTGDDILCVLVSGGGSALLPLPKAPVSLDEKLSVIKMLASAGASIDELNVVRIQLSDTKGGKLAEAAKNSHRLLTFILSDIVGDPIHLIASGPTVANAFTNRDAYNILRKYHLIDSLPQSVNNILTKEEFTQPRIIGDVFLIGSNRIAIDSIIHNAPKSDILALPLSSSVQGNVETLSQTYVKLAMEVRKFQHKKIGASDFVATMNGICEIFSADLNANDITSVVSANLGKNLLFVAGGEPTVVVKGTGSGGRSQELALRFSLECHRRGESLSDVMLLAAGTDGIDGPTDAAGAIGGASVVKSFRSLDVGKNAHQFLEDNDSYSFFQLIDKEGFHIKTGHTGTNVMDIHLLFIPWMRKENIMW